MALVYEVNLKVEKDSVAAFEEWLPLHIEQIVAIDGVLHATWYDRNVLDEGGSQEDADRFVFYSGHYFFRDREAFEVYLRDHAPALRSDGIARFGGKFTATRRVLNKRREFEKK
jgi:hypothetical protein